MVFYSYGMFELLRPLGISGMQCALCAIGQPSLPLAFLMLSAAVNSLHCRVFYQRLAGALSAFAVRTSSAARSFGSNETFRPSAGLPSFRQNLA